MASQPTTAQSLGALLKSARDIMRKDKGLNGDLELNRAADSFGESLLCEPLSPAQGRHSRQRG